jgi:4-amino-4-deoxy-L-arabinose transferase-like glycosyltransferase
MTVEGRVRHDVAPRSRSAAAATAQPPGFPTILMLLAAFAAIWAVYFTLTEGPLAIKHDMAEAYAWGQEFQLGYNQHPPFWAWICGLWFALFPRTMWAFALLSSLNAAIGLWGAWRLIGNFAEGRKHLAAWTLLLLTPLYTFYAYKYNANIIFLSIWPWALHYFVRSVQGKQIGDAICFGIMIGLAMMSKYYAITLVVTCVVAALQQPLRTYLTSPSPYISVAVAAAICAPHGVWLLTHRAPPLQYLTAISGQGWGAVADYAAGTLFGALAMNLGAVLLVALAAWTARNDGPVPAHLTNTRLPMPLHPNASHHPDAPRPALGVLVTLALLPLALTIASGVVLRTRTTPEMTIGTFALLPLLAIEAFGARGIDRLARISVRLAVALTAGALTVSPLIGLARTYLASNAMKVAPFQEVAAEATRLWHQQTSLPLMYVGGSDWYENAIAFYSPDRPHVFVHFDYARNLWVTPQALARHGLLSVCLSTDAICLTATAGFATPRTTRIEVSLAHTFWGHVATPVSFVIQIIPPRI